MHRISAALIAALALLAAPRSAWAFSLDGEYVRDDGKTYLFRANQGIQTGSGDWSCRIRGEVMGAEVRFRFTFTRTKDEGALFRTTGKTVGEYWKEPMKLKVEWVDLDDQGKVKERGEEEHTLKLRRKLTREEDRALGDVIHWHALADNLLDHDSSLYDPAGALDKLLQGDAQSPHPTLEARIKALQAAKTGPSKAEKALAWLQGKQAELANLEKAKDWAGLERLGREAMQGPPDLHSADESCLRLGADAFSKAHALAPEKDAIAFESGAALYWIGNDEAARDVLTKLERRNGAAKDARGRTIAEWLRRFDSAVAHAKRCDAARREADELERTGDKLKASRLRSEADQESAAKTDDAKLFVKYFVESSEKD